MTRTTWLWCAVVLAACAPPTAMTLEFATNLPCPAAPQSQFLALAVGGDAEAVEGTFTETFDSSQCDPATGVIGTWSFRPPKNDPQLTVNVRAVLAPGGDADHVCAPGDRAYDANKCIVARRRVRFTPGAVLRIPILFHDSCLGRPCEANQTCVIGGLCVTSSAIQPSSCASGQTCEVVIDGGSVNVGGGGGSTGGGGGSATGGGGGSATGGGGGAASGGGGGSLDAGADGGTDAGARADAGILVTPTSGLTTREDGGLATVAIRLSAAPTSPVTLTLSSSAPSEAVPTGTTLSFTDTNWNTDQNANLAGVDDPFVDGPQPFTITVTPSSADPRYLNLAPVQLTGMNLDDDVAALRLGQTSGVFTSETGTIVNVRVMLSAQPRAVVSVTFVSNLTAEAIVNGPFFFDGGTWASPQTLRIQGVDDAVQDGDQPFVITSTTMSADPAWNTVIGPDILGINTDDEVVAGQCNVFASQYCGGAPNACCLRNAVDAGIGDCGASGCGADSTHPGLAVGCRVNADCPFNRCWVQGNTVACYSNMDVGISTTRFTCTSNGDCVTFGRNVCVPDPTFPFVKTCQCDVLDSQCGAGAVCVPSQGRCVSLGTETFLTSAQCPPGQMGMSGVNCFEGQGCCHLPATEGCRDPFVCAGGFLDGCASTDDCQPGQFCSFDRMNPTKSRCLNGIEWREACRLGMSTPRNCAAGGACIGVINFVPPLMGQTEIPGMCR